MTLNYRLGPMGFVCLPELKEEAGHTGNYGLFDQMTDYLTNFCKTGNPNRQGLPMWIASDDTQKRVLRLGEGKTRMGAPGKLKLLWTMLTNKAVGE